MFVIDNDQAGDKATEKVKLHFLDKTVIDFRTIYQNNKDFGDFLSEKMCFPETTKKPP